MKDTVVSNRNESVRMFESRFLEAFSHVHPITPLVLFVPVVAWFLYTAFASVGLHAGEVLAGFLGGLFAWTLLEYTLHRHVFHFAPDTRWGRRLHFIMHGVHHEYPNDSTRLVMPPGLSIPLAFVVHAGLAAAAGRFAAPMFAGIVTGYLAYDMLHYAVHHLRARNRLFLALKRNHMLHHYRDDDSRYGVSTPLWDYVFRTR